MKRSRRKLALLGLGLLVPCALLWYLADMRAWQPRLINVKGKIESLELSPKGGVMAVVTSRDEEINNLELWDYDHRRLLWRHSGHLPPMVAFSPDGRLLALLTWPNQLAPERVELWDVRTLKLVRVFSVTRAPQSSDAEYLNYLEFLSDNRTLAVGGRQEMRLYDFTTGKRTRSLRLADQWRTDVMRPFRRPSESSLFRSPTSVVLSRDQKALTTTFETYKVDASGFPDQVSLWTQWQLDWQGHPLRKIKQSASYGELENITSPDGKYFAQLTNGRWKIFDGRTGGLLHTLQPPQATTFGRSLAFSRAGNFLITNFNSDTPNPGSKISPGRRVGVWDVASGRLTRNFAAVPVSAVSNAGLALTPDDNTAVLWYSQDDTHPANIQLWRMR